METLGYMERFGGVILPHMIINFVANTIFLSPVFFWYHDGIYTLFQESRKCKKKTGCVEEGKIEGYRNQLFFLHVIEEKK